MSTEIDWSKAPEGFPIWCESIGNSSPDYSGWHRQNESGDYVDQSGWIWSKRAEGSHFQVYQRPEPWSGSGLPPVGTVCECQMRGYGDVWQKVTILAHHNGHSWVTGDDGKHCFTVPPHGKFRPIKNPEQIESEKIKCEIGDLGQLIINNRKRSNEYELAAVIYQAGYRKVTP